MSKEEVVVKANKEEEEEEEEKKWKEHFVQEGFAVGQKRREESYQEAVKRLKKRREDFFASVDHLLHEAQQSVGPKVSREEVKECEEALGVELPVDYKRFLMEVGDGPLTWEDTSREHSMFSIEYVLGL